MTDSTSSQANNNKTASDSAIKIAIIGGGLTGLFTATLLERALAEAQLDAPNITIYEKSRSVGRLATRYRTDEQTNKTWQWSFGAQFFTAKSASFSTFITPWLQSGLLQPWCAHVVTMTPDSQSGQLPIVEPKEQWDTEKARYISTPKMTSWGRELANHLQHSSIKFSTRVAPLAQYATLQQGEQTELFDDNGESLGCFDWVICTAPNVQASELLANSGFSQQARINEPKMLACYTLMLGWDSVERLPKVLRSEQDIAWDVAHMQASILDRMFIEHQKPAHDQLLPSVTIHARNDWSEAHVDEDIEAIKAQLLTAAQQALDWDEHTVPSQIDCHRWRYAATIVDSKDEELGVLVDSAHNWIVSGDWCGQGNIESAYRLAEQTVAIIQAKMIG